MFKLCLFQVVLCVGVLVVGGVVVEMVCLFVSLQLLSEVLLMVIKGLGVVVVIYDMVIYMLQWMVIYEYFMGLVMVVYFYGFVLVGQNVGVQVLILKDELVSLIKGLKVFIDVQVIDLMGGKWYFNIYMKEYLFGEICGQVMLVN